MLEGLHGVHEMKMGRDVFGNGRRIDETLERFVFENWDKSPQKKWDKGVAG